MKGPDKKCLSTSPLMKQSPKISQSTKLSPGLTKIILAKTAYSQAQALVNLTKDSFSRLSLAIVKAQPRISQSIAKAQSKISQALLNPLRPHVVKVTYNRGCS